MLDVEARNRIRDFPAMVIVFDVECLQGGFCFENGGENGEEDEQFNDLIESGSI